MVRVEGWGVLVDGEGIRLGFRDWAGSHCDLRGELWGGGWGWVVGGLGLGSRV